jgi:branched-subunit amino acid aminotransferase/4-amino-4-deoxychorismate lyase
MDSDDEEEEEASMKHRRERAFSECPKWQQHQKRRQRSASALTLNRPQSDTDLSQIDRAKTFDAQRAALEPGELLAKVTIALGGYRVDVVDESAEELGVHGFSDSEILASEQYYSDWSIETSEQSCSVGRNRRALSEVRIPMEMEKVRGICAENVERKVVGSF